jgi:hypothetical protein
MLRNLGFNNLLRRHKVQAFLLFHQGWTDVFNCLALITHYSKSYENLNVIIRDDALPIVQFYLRNTNVNIKTVKKEVLDIMSEEITPDEKNLLKLYHGDWDIYRKDEYKDAFQKSDKFFVEKFYTEYNIPYLTRVCCFTFSRDLIAENMIYDNFIKKIGNDYILTHVDPARTLNIPTIYSTSAIFNLNGVSTVFFDWIKVLENAKEIHLIDSVWSSFIYQLDAKYGIFKKIPIYIYCLRGYAEMYQKPKLLNNWTFR